MMTMFARTILCASLISILIACGGGGDSSTVAVVPDKPVKPAKPIDPVIASPKTELSVLCNGLNCGAQDSNTFNGAGIGLWAYDNTGTQEAVLPVSINNVLGKTLTVVYTNLDTKAQPLNIPFSADIKANILQNNLPTNTEGNHEKIQKFNIEGYKSILKPSEANTSIARSMLTLVNDAVVGDTKVWSYYLDTGPSVQATFILAQQVTAYDGKKINFWVDINEYNTSKVLDVDVINLAQSFANGDDSLYKNVINLAGQPFGTNTFANLISPSNPSLNVVIANLNPDKQPYGKIGYFASENTFQKSSMPASNEALALFIDSETIYIPVSGVSKSVAMTSITSSLVHEFTHMINFSQRAVLKRAAFPNTWLEETSALGMEDILSNKINPSYSIQRDNRYLAFLQSAQYNCPMHLVNKGCDDYQRASTFISFLNRKYGVNFYKGLLKNFSSDQPMTLMDNQIKASGGIGYQDELKKFSTNFALMPASNLPVGFGFPAIVSEGYTLPAIYRNDLSKYVYPPLKPSALNSDGSMYYFEIKNLPTSYIQNIPVPAKTNVSIVMK
jgi:Peptidase M30